MIVRDPHTEKAMLNVGGYDSKREVSYHILRGAGDFWLEELTPQAGIRHKELEGLNLYSFGFRVVRTAKETR